MTTRKLARDVDVDAYIYNADAPRDASRTASPVSHLARLAVVSSLLLVGAVLGQLFVWSAGLHIVTSREVRLVEAIYRVDPHPDRWTDTQLLERLQIRKDAVELMERAIASPRSSETYPYIATLVGHTPPAIDPGIGPGFLMLARAIELFPKGMRGRLVASVVDVGAALGDYDVQAALQILVNLDKATRRHLFEDQATSFRRIVEQEIAIEDSRADKAGLLDQLGAQRQTIDVELRGVRAAISNAQDRVEALARIDRTCAAKIALYAACLANTSRSLSAP